VLQRVVLRERGAERIHHGLAERVECDVVLRHRHAEHVGAAGVEHRLVPRHHDLQPLVFGANRAENRLHGARLRGVERGEVLLGAGVAFR